MIYKPDFYVRFFIYINANMASELNINTLPQKQKDIIWEFVKDFKYEQYSMQNEYVDYKLFEDVDPKQILLYFSKKMSEL